MDVLKNKKYINTDYTCRCTGVPFYYNTKDDREICGLGHNLNKNNAWVAHKVKPTDSLDSLALNYYNNPTYWWVIAYFNDIQDPFIKLADEYTVLKIPSITSIEFKDPR